MGIPLLERRLPELVLLKPAQEPRLHFLHVGQKPTSLFFLFPWIERPPDQQLVGQLGWMTRIELRLVEPMGMIADEQAHIGVPFGQPRNAQPPSLHARHRVCHDLSQTLRQSVIGGQRRIGLPLPPPVIVFGHGEHHFPSHTLRVGGGREMARRRELLVAPVSRQLTGQFRVRRLRDQPHL